MDLCLDNQLTHSSYLVSIEMGFPCMDLCLDNQLTHSSYLDSHQTNNQLISSSSSLHNNLNLASLYNNHNLDSLHNLNQDNLQDHHSQVNKHKMARLLVNLNLKVSKSRKDNLSQQWANSSLDRHKLNLNMDISE